MKAPEDVIAKCIEVVLVFAPNMPRDTAEAIARAVLRTAQNATQDGRYKDFAAHIGLQPAAQLDDRPRRWPGRWWPA